jgi:integral membrane protein (TIGR01906 family)
MKLVHRIISFFIAILIPLALVFLSVRLILTHAFLQAEYHMPGFPADEYGFSQADRLHYAPLAWDYLLNDADISFLGELTFPDGSSLYNGRELSHMQDVKDVVRPVLWIGYGLWAFLLGTGAWAWFGRWWENYKRGIRGGGWASVGLVVVIGIFAALSFWQFFTIFHGLFFSEGSWMFLYSDTLIRLFPMRFWQDTFLFVGIITFVGGLILALVFRPGKKPKAI